MGEWNWYSFALGIFVGIVAGAVAIIAVALRAKTIRDSEEPGNTSDSIDRDDGDHGPDRSGRQKKGLTFYEVEGMPHFRQTPATEKAGRENRQRFTVERKEPEGEDLN